MLLFCLVLIFSVASLFSGAIDIGVSSLLAGGDEMKLKIFLHFDNENNLWNGRNRYLLNFYYWFQHLLVVLLPKEEKLK